MKTNIFEIGDAILCFNTSQIMDSYEFQDFFKDI